MPMYTWTYLHSNLRPNEYQVINVLARDHVSGEVVQFLATYSSYTVYGKKKDVWTSLGSEFLFDEKSVLAWCPRLGEEDGHYSYKWDGD